MRKKFHSYFEQEYRQEKFDRQMLADRLIDLLSTKENVKSPDSVGNAGWRFDIGMEKVNNWQDKLEELDSIRRLKEQAEELYAGAEDFYRIKVGLSRLPVHSREPVCA